MPYRIRMNVRNPGPQPLPVTVHAGTIFQVRNPFARVQNLSVTRTTTFVVPPRSSIVKHVPAWCINRTFAPPCAVPMSITPLRTAKTYGSQQAAWDDLDGNR